MQPRDLPPGPMSKSLAVACGMARDCAVEARGVYLMAIGAGHEMPSCSSVTAPIADLAIQVQRGLDEIVERLDGLTKQV